MMKDHGLLKIPLSRTDIENDKTKAKNSKKKTIGILIKFIRYMHYPMLIKNVCCNIIFIH